MKPADSASVYEQFQEEVASLRGDALLDKRIAFEGLPASEEGERDLRLKMRVCLEAALIREFGLGGWQKQLAERRKAASLG